MAAQPIFVVIFCSVTKYDTSIISIFSVFGKWLNESGSFLA